jgi:hypothetical protein
VPPGFRGAFARLAPQPGRAGPCLAVAAVYDPRQLELQRVELSLKRPIICAACQSCSDWVESNVRPLLAVRFLRPQNMVKEAFLPVRRYNSLLPESLRKGVLEGLHPGCQRNRVGRKGHEHVQVIRHENVPANINPTRASLLRKLLERLQNILLREKVSPLACADRDEVNCAPGENEIKPTETIGSHVRFPFCSGSL